MLNQEIDHFDCEIFKTMFNLSSLIYLAYANVCNNGCAFTCIRHCIPESQNEHIGLSSSEAYFILFLNQELLALEERMGTVSTALSEEQLLRCLKRSIYTTDHVASGITFCGDEDMKCSICQVFFW